MAEFVTAWSKATGVEHWVPSNWFEPGNEKLVNDLTLEAPNGVSDAEVRQGPPDESWLNEEIEAYARTHNIDLGKASKKADMLAVISEAQESTPVDEPAKTAIGTAHPGPSQTPTTGEKE